MGNMCDNFIIYEDNKNEFQIWQGLVGAHYTPYVDANGNLSWTNNGDLPNPPTVNIKGAPGTGLEIKGIVETVGDLPQTANYGDVYLVGSEAPYDGYVYVNGTWTYLGVVGVGQDGRGIASITKTSTVGLVDTYTITYTDGSTPTTFTVTNGADGSPGVGVPTGGTSGQVLKKASSTDYDTEWGVVEALPTGGTTGQVLSKASNTDYDVEWADASGGDVQTVNNVQPDANGNVLITADDIGTDANGISVQDAIDDAVHVGTSAPTDPTCKIWLDTDEPGMSAVSSVNGATGTVVLDADDVGAMAEWDLLWTNASPTSAFSAQTVQLNLSGYTHVAVLSYAFTSSLQIDPINICPVGSNFVICSLSIGDSVLGGREGKTSSSGIQFETAYYNRSTNSGNSIPWKIYGVKGIQTS